MKTPVFLRMLGARPRMRMRKPKPVPFVKRAGGRQRHLRITDRKGRSIILRREDIAPLLGLFMTQEETSRILKQLTFPTSLSTMLKRLYPAVTP